MTTLPIWIWFVGAFVLGTVMVYGIFTTRGRTRQQREITDEATKELYRQENRSG
jgi:hypothetical protein